MTRTLEQIQVVAFEARQAFETDSIPFELLVELYRPHVPRAKNVDIFIKTVLQWFPHGSCKLASLYLEHELQVGEVYEGSYLDKSHTYHDIGVIAANHIVDITADQFGGPAVYVGPLDLPWRREKELA